ncbi:hypothetical protein [Mycobacterium talmoniae]|uniref:Secreted protein n=1 Tax=Mycobacterium talmoniae TaxID=1858794 RepID=A0A1S1NQK9_9MYCO|nr:MULTISPECIES: hypothetical protein [Mycobacterium]OHV06672.1 hypothetical protein BKN37_01500 [Mycobacterium talmoniae]PQM47151.1 hypothetical protein C1Y40_02664 [Mycobacterium talmoniae]TDH44613.1 hypothetical protein E2F47_27805 [Mycobacterium eburneum]
MSFSARTNRVLASLGVGAALTFAAVAGASPAAATNPNNPGGGMDPHLPNTMQGWCPGGGAGGISGDGYCDGTKYPDGSFWHIVRFGVPFAGEQIKMSCVVDNGSPLPPLAPPGGCNGAA